MTVHTAFRPSGRPARRGDAPGPHPRPHLTLVPTGPDVEAGSGGAHGAPTQPVAPPRRQPRAGASMGSGAARRQDSAPRSHVPEPPLRLTPLGRLVVGLLVALVLCAVATVVTSRGATAAREVVTVTVEAGETMSGIADEYLPELTVREGVARLQLFNGLSSSHIHVGQVLRIPDL